MDDAKEIIDFKQAIEDILPNLRAMGEAFQIPFIKALKIMEQDRDMAIENYNRFKDLMDNGDDSDSVRQGLNEAMHHILKSTEKLNVMIASSGKMISDSIKAISMAKAMEGKQNKEYFKNIRATAISVKPEDEKK